MEIKARNPYRIVGNHIEMDLGRDFVALFDSDDLHKLSRYQWYPAHHGHANCAFGCRDHVYPCTAKKDGAKSILRAHNLVLDFTPNNGLTIDHINKNPLDNRKDNLRIATKNMQNINHTIQKNSTTMRPGVSLYTKPDRYYVACWVEHGRKQRRYYSVKTLGEENARQQATARRLEAERSIPDYADALYNRRKMIQLLTEQTGENDWDNVPTTELIQLMLDFQIDVETCRC